MKTLFSTFVFTLALTLSLSAQTDSTGFAGDHFSLEGAIELFKKAKSPEEFEKLLNQKNQEVNNLDLNLDGDVDYIRVIDHKNGDVHALVLQVPVSAKESQDIAVIEIEKTGKESAILQIIGNEDVYGKEVIAEPFEEETRGRDSRGPAGEEDYSARIVVNVWFWPCVTYIYGPAYIVWVSPWSWRYYPAWWSPWRPVPWRVFHRYTIRWRPHYHRVTVHRVTRAHKVYAPRRTSSVTVSKRTTVIRKNTTVRKKTNPRVRKDGKSTEAATRTTTRAVKKSDGTVRPGTKTARKNVTKSTSGTKKVTRRTSKAAPGKSGVRKTGKATKRKKNG
jgi:hypothetical protein